MPRGAPSVMFPILSHMLYMAPYAGTPVPWYSSLTLRRSLEMVSSLSCGTSSDSAIPIDQGKCVTRARPERQRVTQKMPMKTAQASHSAVNTLCRTTARHRSNQNQPHAGIPAPRTHKFPRNTPTVSASKAAKQESTHAVQGPPALQTPTCTCKAATAPTKNAHHIMSRLFQPYHPDTSPT